MWRLFFFLENSLGLKIRYNLLQTATEAEEIAK